jgi:hypothetical protein
MQMLSFLTYLHWHKDQILPNLLILHSLNSHASCQCLQYLQLTVYARDLEMRETV